MTNVVPLHLQVVLPLALRRRIDRLAAQSIRSRDEILLRAIEAGLPAVEARPPTVLGDTPTFHLTVTEINDPNDAA
jgi:hypothetical protein